MPKGGEVNAAAEALRTHSHADMPVDFEELLPVTPAVEAVSAGVG